MSNWILLRGLMRDSRHWGDFPALLRRELGTVRIARLDLPGNGPLYRMQSPARVEAMVECYRRTLLQQGIAPPYRLLAMSLGAMTAVAWAARYPQELDACVLINTSLRPFSPFYQRLRLRNYPSLLRLALQQPAADRRERLILSLTSNNRHAQREVLDTWTSYQRDCPVSRGNTWRQLLAALRYRAPYGKPPVPLLILASAGDRLVDPQCSQHLAREWHSTLALHPGAGHDLPLDDGSWVARQVGAWLRTRHALSVPG
jgi:pimeloyl-ACP methyl ester carboxylesterase